jgi:hypothetical protein
MKRCGTLEPSGFLERKAREGQFQMRSYKMSETGKRTTDATKAAALYMLKNGLASYKEIAELSGRSRQIIRIWGGKVDALDARKRYLQRVWARAIGPRR